ncbi:hypothetical protein RUM44_008613 [Polyplax serrata]|uniref:Secreted protein n=1 Tax=Polyplax serrata TaxID=468196 RepID=A0ABR1BD71_POLSC
MIKLNSNFRFGVFLFWLAGLDESEGNFGRQPGVSCQGKRKKGCRIFILPLLQSQRKFFFGGDVQNKGRTFRFVNSCASVPHQRSNRETTTTYFFACQREGTSSPHMLAYSDLNLNLNTD